MTRMQQKLASFLLAALSSVLKLKGVNENGEYDLFLQLLHKNFGQLSLNDNMLRPLKSSRETGERLQPFLF